MASRHPVTPSFAAEIATSTWGANRPHASARDQDAFTQYAVLDPFPINILSQDQHLEFARYFGPLETTIAVYRKDAALRLRKELPTFPTQSREQGLGQAKQTSLVPIGNRLWHRDSRSSEYPARASLLYARSIPPVGGHTEFADERAAYVALPEETNVVSIAWCRASSHSCRSLILKIVSR